jgi:two-component system, NtrC family, nitrogen regulation response regulator NtrX
MFVQVRSPGARPAATTSEVLVSDTDTPRYVLVVEDDDGICEVISAVLADAGYESACAQSTEQALRLVEERRPGLILLDLSVVGSDLDALLAAYRRAPGQAAPIVVMSGHPRIRDLAAEIGADAIVEKPFDVLVLLDTVEAAFER